MIKRMPFETNRPAVKPAPFPPRRDYASLSIKDLLDAREAYHVYLSTLENVVATAIGRYLIHERDWYAKYPPDHPRPDNVKLITEARTLTNSVIRPWSWPAVLVFVDDWKQPKSLGSQLIPKTLYLPDGRAVPTCVVQAEPDPSLPGPSTAFARNSSLLGGGYSCLRDHQGEQSLGTFACLVKKGGTYYALTNRHVAGGDGEVVRAYVRGEYVEVGRTANIAIDHLLMSEMFPAWPGTHTFLAGDAGLVRIDDINDWTSQAFGIGEIGMLFDATEQTITLDLIGCPVRAFGGVSGVAEGEILALFFSYQHLGGFEYATDVLIAPRTKARAKVVAAATAATVPNNFAKPLTRPGDSGTLWFYDPPIVSQSSASKSKFQGIEHVEVDRGPRAPRLRPIAMQWGGERFVGEDGTATAYALGSFLSSICRVLDVEVISNWSTGHDEYWGKIGHFAIGWKACDQVSGALGTLMGKNQKNVGFGNEDLGKGSEFRMDKTGFIPLADVPDYVWVENKKGRPFEGIQHFADIDIQDIHGGATLLKRCVDTPKQFVSAKEWKKYFDGFAQAGVGPDPGCLPFRVWQIWNAMVGYLDQTKPDVLRFVAAAGVLAHYVGDASQPLHCSFMHHGVPPMKTVNGRKYPVRKESAEFIAFKKTAASKIHGIYEETMLEVDAATALMDVDTLLKKKSKVGPVASGFDAAVETIQLMARSQDRLAPLTIIKADDPTLGPKARSKRLWDNKAIRQATIASLADSVQVLGALWAAAWKVGGGSKVAKGKLAEFTPGALEKVYRTEAKFVPSLSLDQMAQSGKFEP